METFIVQEILAVWTRLRASKTFYTALAAIVAAVHGFAIGRLTGHQAIGFVLSALALMGIRDALAKLGASSALSGFEAFVHGLAFLAPEDLPAPVRQAIERHGVPVATVQSIFKHALELVDDPSTPPPPKPLPVVQPPTTPPPAA